MLDFFEVLFDPLKPKKDFFSYAFSKLKKFGSLYALPSLCEFDSSISATDSKNKAFLYSFSF